MFFIPPDASIYFYGLPVDLRKGCEGLACFFYRLAMALHMNTRKVYIQDQKNRMKILEK